MQVNFFRDTTSQKKPDTILFVVATFMKAHMPDLSTGCLTNRLLNIPGTKRSHQVDFTDSCAAE